MSTTTLKIQAETTPAKWKEGAHTLLMKISKHLPHRQCCLDSNQPCVKDFGGCSGDKRAEIFAA